VASAIYITLVYTQYALFSGLVVFSYQPQIQAERKQLKNRATSPLAVCPASIVSINLVHISWGLKYHNIKIFFN